MKVSIFRSLLQWFDAEREAPSPARGADSERIDWLRCVPFFASHVACLAVLWVGYSATAVLVAVFLYAARMFAITAFYHRFFSHRTFKTSRFAQFVFAVLGNSAAQRGPLWWAAHHRHHHRHSDLEEDTHSPRQHGFLWSHMFWFTSRSNFRTRHELVRDFSCYPELRFLDRFDVLVPLIGGVGLVILGETLAAFAPSLQTSGLQLLVWGVISTVVLFHSSCTINSLAHRVGTRRFDTGDDSRNSLILALLTFGEGWHNNHHHFPGSVRQGFYWWEVDISYYLLRLLAFFGLIWDLRPVPQRVLESGRQGRFEPVLAEKVEVPR